LLERHGRGVVVDGIGIGRRRIREVLHAPLVLPGVVHPHFVSSAAAVTASSEHEDRLVVRVVGHPGKRVPGPAARRRDVDTVRVEALGIDVHPGVERDVGEGRVHTRVRDATAQKHESEE
jgi:hypothetical protein